MFALVKSIIQLVGRQIEIAFMYKTVLKELYLCTIFLVNILKQFVLTKKSLKLDLRLPSAF